MKKMLLSVMVFVAVPMRGQEAQVDPTSSSLAKELRALPAKDQTFDQKLSSFEKAVEYLKGARDCLSGIGCTKRKSYLANYLLGATYGFAQSTVFTAIAQKDPARWIGNPSAGQLGLGVKLRWLNLLVNELGYRYLVKEKVYLFRCLTFRGCTDQTKRYAFYNLGIWSGRIGAVLPMVIESVRYQAEAARQRPQREREMRLRQTHVQVTDNAIKEELELDPEKDFFLWYEILGFEEEPSLKKAKIEYRQRSRKYHPDKARNDEEKRLLYTEIQQTLNSAQDKGNLRR